MFKWIISKLLRRKTKATGHPAFANPLQEVQVVTAWGGAGTTANPYQPQVAIDYPFDSWTDLSGADPPTGTYTIDGFMLVADYNNLAADPAYSGKVTPIGNPS